MDLNDFGPVPEHTARPGIPARVTAQHRERWEVVCEQGRTYARIKKKEYYAGRELFPTAGDYVMLDYIENGDSRILSTLPRRTFFARRAPGTIPGEQAVAANFDYVLVLQSMNQNFNLRRLERYLTLARQSGATPVVVLTKADLAEDVDAYRTKAASVAGGADIRAVSARTGCGLDGLGKYLQPGKTLVLLGSSGVGKSSLVNALAGEELMAEGGIRLQDGRGRHTTTHRELIRLPGGALIIDTPGMREMGLWEAEEGLTDAFADVEQFLGRCRFSDCRHEKEPGCAVRAALRSGELDRSRWESYRKLHAEAAERETILRRKKAWGKEVAIQRRQRLREED